MLSGSAYRSLDAHDGHTRHVTTGEEPAGRKGEDDGDDDDGGGTMYSLSMQVPTYSQNPLAVCTRLDGQMHCDSDVEVFEMVVRPLGHRLQDFDPGVLENESLGQTWHSPCATSGENLPAGHASQTWLMLVTLNDVVGFVALRSM
jgi:hypothetical protein